MQIKDTKNNFFKSIFQLYAKSRDFKGYMELMTSWKPWEWDSALFPKLFVLKV